MDKSAGQTIERSAPRNSTACANATKWGVGLITCITYCNQTGMLSIGVPSHHCTTNRSDNVCLSLRADVGLEVGGNFDDQYKCSLVHIRVDLGRPDLHRRPERRRNERFRDWQEGG
jgi:hypothetical protein